MIHKILRLFVNTLTVDDTHYLVNRHNLTRPIQKQLSQKEKTFSQFFFAFLKSILNYKHLPKKQKILIADVFPEIPALKNILSKMSKKPCFRGPLDIQRRKCIETLLESGWQNVYNNYF